MWAVIGAGSIHKRQLHIRGSRNQSRVKDPSPYMIQHVPLACDATNPLSSLASEISFSDPPSPPAGRLCFKAIVKASGSEARLAYQAMTNALSPRGGVAQAASIKGRGLTSESNSCLNEWTAFRLRKISICRRDDPLGKLRRQANPTSNMPTGLSRVNGLAGGCQLWLSSSGKTAGCINTVDIA